ncbi:hypothetical protein M011DRAFT_471268 [Sporormia fimetaria CBS 119925]|uniref:CipC-like antibiotic response protein n=1 Tax=Sporormia fimetaria CBS 119925 TaxID=1340428 RepID=A0A6A6UZB7_9PLEO|nr:hypothetical protein M011DRAFT_471268 [Sporormia fimetaria CBS 119925]
MREMDGREHRHLGQEVLAGGIAMEGLKKFEEHQRREGKPVSHTFAKALLAGITGAEVDKYAQEHGQGWLNREATMRQAQQNAERMYNDYYVQQQGAAMYDPYAYGPPAEIRGPRW